MAPSYLTFNHEDLRIAAAEEKNVPGTSGGKYFDIIIKRAGKDHKTGQVKEMLPIYSIGRSDGKGCLNKTSGVILRANESDGSISKSVQVWWDISWAQNQLEDDVIRNMTDEGWAALEPATGDATPIYVARKKSYEEQRAKMNLKDKHGELLPPYNDYVIQQKLKIRMILTIYLVAQHAIEKSKTKMGLLMFDVNNPVAVKQFFKSPVYWPVDENGVEKPTGTASTYFKLMDYVGWSTKLNIIGMGAQDLSLLHEDATRKFACWMDMDIFVNKVYVQKGKSASLQLRDTEMTVYNIAERVRDDEQKSREAAEENPEMAADMSRKVQELMSRMAMTPAAENMVPQAPESHEEAIRSATTKAAPSAVVEEKKPQQLDVRSFLLGGQ